MVSPGDSLGTRYRLVGPLGHGGMATVWRALDVVLDRPVAVKIPREDWPDEFRRRFREEAKAAARLNHPNITGVHDYGEEDQPYVVMELLEGESLSARLAEGALPWQEVAGIGAQLADALAAAHALQVVHRDIKPANVFLTPTGIKILDFGIAFISAAAAEADGLLLGTPGYIAPELQAGEEPTPSADVYSLGVTLLAALAGRTAVSAEELPALDVPEPMARLLQSCLEEAPEERPSAVEVAAGLRRAAGLPDVVAPGRRPARASDVPASDVPAGDLDPTPRPGHTTKVLDEPERVPLREAEPASEPGLPRGRALLIASGVIVALGPLALLISHLPGTGGDGSSAAPPGVSRTPQKAVTQCAVAYSVNGQWPGGFQVEVRVTNLGGSPIDGWRLAWTFPGGQRITQLWNGGREQVGNEVTVTAADWNRTIQPRGTAQFGFLGQDDDGAHRKPARFTLNGTECRVTA
ncbi:protein kinase domain-containing protein [Actinomadura rudentiformis]|uniref:non-specific serine/threonine protein kinase n=1 Tax=Actinomadura rudentiformis TaxID=359158 RepID=A0A6H9YQ50_9ACTN|nr:cellulose binding domain-containing protein [Actinomadura rudentiformis]KAB2349517.1 protein kinase [Actinomadura rudentiformis]